MNNKPYSRRTFLKLSTAAAASLSISAAPNHRDMPYRILGRTGESVSLLGLGGAHLAHHGNMEEKAAIALMHAAIDEGINFSIMLGAIPMAKVRSAWARHSAAAIATTYF